MLQPKRTKFRKNTQGATATVVWLRGADIASGSFGLKAVGRGRLTARRIGSTSVL